MTTAAEYAAGLRQLADLIEAHPELPEPYYLRHHFHVWSLTDADEVRRVGFAALRAGAEVVKDYSDDLMSLDIRLRGGIVAQGLVWRSKVCERVLVGTDTELVEEPDPEAPLVTIPDPRVTRQIEKRIDRYEWRCGPDTSASTA